MPFFIRIKILHLLFYEATSFGIYIEIYKSSFFSDTILKKLYIMRKDLLLKKVGFKYTCLLCIIYGRVSS